MLLALTTVGIMSIALIGKLTTIGRLGVLLRRHDIYLTTFVTGVFLVITIHITQEVIHSLPLLSTVLWTALGALVVESIMHMLPNAHHHHMHNCRHTHTRGDARRILLSDTVHNASDGIVLSTAFIAGTSTGIGVAIGIALHEIIQEISEFFVLRQAGYTTSRALVLNALTSLGLPIGVCAALILSTLSLSADILAALANGGIIMMLTRDLIPHTIRTIRRSGHAHRHVVAALLGIITMAITLLFA